MVQLSRFPKAGIAMLVVCTFVLFTFWNEINLFRVGTVTEQDRLRGATPAMANTPATTAVPTPAPTVDAESIAFELAMRTDPVEFPLRQTPWVKKSVNLCVLVRTYPNQRKELRALLEMFRATNIYDWINVDVYVFNTDDVNFEDEALDQTIAELGATGLHWTGYSPLHDRFGYDMTDMAIQYLMRKGKRTDGTSSSCSHFMFTNGDNMYNSGMFASTKSPSSKNLPILKDALQDKIHNDLVLFDFICHHHPEQFTPVVMIKGRIDLGAGIFSARVFDDGVRFLPQGAETHDLFNRDWLTFHTVSAKYKVAFVHRVLFMHQ